MTRIFLNSLIVIGLFLFSLITCSTLFAQQNLITNGDFEAGNTGFFTNYIYEPTYGMLAGRYCIDNTVDGHGENNSFLPPDQSNSTGKYMIVNGYGGSNNQNQVVWRQTVNVTSGTWYTFSFKYANLSKYFPFYSDGAQLRFLINGVQPSGAPDYIQLNPGDNTWHTYSNFRWNSGNLSGSINIEFRDVFSGNSDRGDDFALDNITFVPDVVYSVNAQDDYVTTALCLNEYVDVDVLQNDNVLPNTNDAQVQVITDPIPHGTAGPSPLDSKKIRYTFTDANYNGEVQFNYRVTNHGVVSEATVHINTARPPTISNINLPSTIDICEGDTLTLPPPTVTENGSTITSQGWQVKVNGSWQNVNGNTIPSVADGYTSVRYFAENQCDTAYSDEFQLVVSDEPTIGSISNIIQASFCAPTTFSCSPPSIQNNGSEPIAWGWQMQIGGQWVNVPNPIEYQHNGCNIRYYATNDCGTNYSNTAAITVNAAPIVPNITAPAGVCEGQSLVLTPPSNIQWRHNDPNTCSGCWQVYLNGAWQDISGNSIPSISYNTYNGCHIRYKAHNGCDDGYSNEVAITVYSTQPVDLGDVTFCQEGYFHGVWCSQDGHVYGYDSLTPNNCTIHVSWLFHLSEDYNTHPQTQTECDEFYWPQTGITYYNSGIYYDTIPNPNPVECDDVYILNLTINNAPEILENLEAPQSVCVDSPLAVNVPQYTMNHPNGDAHWEYATSSSGPFTPFDPSTSNLTYGTYYLRFAVTNDCDSNFSNVVQFNVNGIPEIEGQLNAIQVCEGQTMDLPEVDVEWRNVNENDRVGEWQMANTEGGTYAPINPNMTMQMSHNGCFIRYYAHTSCGTDILGPVLITVLSAEDQWLETITACDSYTLPSGEVIMTSQVVDYEVMEPCFHIVHQPVEINNSDYKVEPITWCQDDYEWHGRIFYRSEQTQYAWDTLVNQAGCDSIVELNLNFDDYSTFTHTRTACGSYVWEMKPDVTYTESTRDSLFVPAVGDEDCDTWYYLDLTLGHDTLVEGGFMTQCSGFVWHGVTYYEDAVVYDSLLTVGTHCDSIIAYQIHIIQPVERDTAIVSCQPIWWHGHYCEEEGDFVHTFQSEYGCDSIVTMHFSLQEAIERQVDTVVCAPFEWHGHAFNGNGQASHTFVSPQGCDSIVHLTVTFSETEIQPESLSACDTYEFQGVVYDEPGFYEIYHDTVFAPNGCVATVQLLNLTVSDADQLGVISGSSSVYVASNIISGIYRYEMDTTGVQGHISWSLSNPDWHIVEEGDNYCRIFVGTAGSAVLQAQFMTASCGYVVRDFEINAGYFGVDEQAFEVNLFPNPTKGMVRIEAEGIESVRVVDMMGQVLGQWQCDRSNQFDLNLGGFEPSVYLLEIKTGQGLAKKRVTVCR